MLILAVIAACSEAPPTPAPAPASMWHWIDAAGDVVSDGPDLPVIVDDAGLAWALHTDGYFEPEIQRERWFTEPGCRGRPFVRHPVAAMEPIRLGFDPTVYYWLPADGPEVSSSPQRFGSTETTGIGGSTCTDGPVYVPGTVPVDVLDRGDVLSPEPVFMPPFRRVR